MAEIDEADWDRVLHVNLKGVMLACRAVLPDMNVIVLTHEDIPGYMGPMTMGFRVHEPQIYRGLDIGDPVRFTLKGVPPNLSITAIVREDKP